ncbi:hypothetical protein GCM10007901_29400 [Dyella acidisoli]|uniref:Uncharacterized protein n=1 Tax=Dyella acidisoli TaxID=1867834 RepID=A0ABQ5XQJ3_9GAMM|nr:hypothetical protein GCM10007901_29400 [Dyella acidisoli]
MGDVQAALYGFGIGYRVDYVASGSQAAHDGIGNQGIVFNEQYAHTTDEVLGRKILSANAAFICHVIGATADRIDRALQCAP